MQQSQDEVEPYVGGDLMEVRFEVSVADVVVVVGNCFLHLVLVPVPALALAVVVVAVVEKPNGS